MEGSDDHAHPISLVRVLNCGLHTIRMEVDEVLCANAISAKPSCTDPYHRSSLIELSMSLSVSSFTVFLKNRNFISKIRRSKVTDYAALMQGKCIAECSKGSILQYFRPSLSYYLSLMSLFCLFLSGRLTQVLLYAFSHSLTMGA